MIDRKKTWQYKRILEILHDNWLNKPDVSRVHVTMDFDGDDDANAGEKNIYSQIVWLDEEVHGPHCNDDRETMEMNYDDYINSLGTEIQLSKNIYKNLKYSIDKERIVQSSMHQLENAVEELLIAIDRQKGTQKHVPYNEINYYEWYLKQCAIQFVLAVQGARKDKDHEN